MAILGARLSLAAGFASSVADVGRPSMTMGLALKDTRKPRTKGPPDLQMTTPRRHPNVVHRDEIRPVAIARGRHQAVRRSFGAAAGSCQLGGSLMEVAPGSVSYPFHFHCANEEAIYVISGTGAVRIGDARVQVRAGDWIAFPVGPEHAHEMINDGTEPLVYLAIGTEHKCDVLGYPDSNKIQAIGGASWDDLWVRQIVRRGDGLDYWDGEPDAGGD
jgi:uncharacterized cupin superfamily protein